MNGPRSTAPDLLPCPFCGGAGPEFERLGTSRQSCIVACGDCGARHESSDEGANSGRSWNERAAPPQAPRSADQERELPPLPLGKLMGSGTINGKRVELRMHDDAAMQAYARAARAAHQEATAPADTEFEVRDDGVRVRKDRWEWGIRRIVALLWGNRHAFEVDEVVEAVRKAVPEPFNAGDDEGLVRSVSALAAPLPPSDSAAVVALTDERIDHLWDTRVGDLTPQRPLTGNDVYQFARAIEYEVRAALAAKGEHHG